MRNRFLMIVGVAVGMGLVASALVYLLVRNPQDPEPYESIVVASVNLPLGIEVKNAQVKLVDWPKKSLPAGALKKVADAENRIVRGSIVAGEPLLETKLAPKNSGIMSTLIPPGHRGVTIKVDDAAKESGFIVPGNRVDVLVSMTKEPGSQERFAKVILQNVPVLAAGQIVEVRDNKTVTVTTVTLALRPDQTERLALAQVEGRLILAIRNLDDNNVVRTTGVNIPALWIDGEPAKSPAARPRPDIRPVTNEPRVEAEVETVKGDKREITRFIENQGTWTERPRK